MNPWIEAMRLRTLPVSVSGVVVAAGYASAMPGCKWLPAFLCLLFAVTAQISSNFANEYYDFKAGIDRQGREGPRRGVTEGDITPRAMKIATYASLGVACCIGLALLFWGGWWLLLVGLFIAIGVLAYSAGPYPLSRHALGEVAVLIFFGIVPVNFTFYLMTGEFSWNVFAGSVAIGLLGANILLVNNYRDADDDREVGKMTVAVKLGRRFASTCYLVNGYLAVALMGEAWLSNGVAWVVAPVIFLALHTMLWHRITHKSGRQLNPMLGMTAMLMFAYSLAFLVALRF